MNKLKSGTIKSGVGRMSLRAYQSSTEKTGKVKAEREKTDHEHPEQAQLFLRLKRISPLMYDHAAAVPNGGDRNSIVAGKLKKEGVKKGYPDVLVDLPRGQYHGLRIEMKRPRIDGKRMGSTNDHQREWMTRLSAAGYYCAYCEGWIEALFVCMEYFSLGAFSQTCTITLPDRISDWLRKRPKQAPMAVAQ